MNKNTLLIVTSIYKNYRVLHDFFNSLKKQTDSNFHVFIWDATENPKKIIYPKFTTIVQGNNKGYAYAVNQGLTYGKNNRYQLFCVINSDVIVDKNFVKNVKISLKQHSGSLIGGKIYYAPGFEYHSKSYTKKQMGSVLWYAGGWVNWKHVLVCHRGVDKVDRGQFSQLEKTQFITGCMMAFTQKAVDDIGYWDESYFLYYEDADFCMRALKKKYSLIYDPSLILWHKNSQSTGGSGSNIHIYYQEKSRLLFGIKYAPVRTKIHLLKNILWSFIKKKMHRKTI